MLHIFDLLLFLYPAEFRREFGDEMRGVFVAAAGGRGLGSPFVWNEYCGLIRGAAAEWRRHMGKLAAAMAGGAVFALCGQFLLYWYLVPGKDKGLARVLQHLVSQVFLVCLLAGIASGQPAKEVPSTVELARSIYSSSFRALREAKTLDDLRKLSDEIDSPEWISVDRFGRTVLTKKEADRDLESLLALPPERRVAGMDVIWAEQDAERLMVVAWMMPSQAERVDAEGEYGPKGEKHRLTRGTLIRDIFVKTADGWRRIRHDKLLPNDTVLAVDGTPRVLPPADERHRVVPGN